MKELRFAPTHEWLQVLENGRGQIGISEHAQAELGDIVFLELPAVGSKLIKGESFATVESVKAVSELYAPVDGVVVSVNEALIEQPELLNQDPLHHWVVEIAEMGTSDDLLTEEDYLATL